MLTDITPLSRGERTARFRRELMAAGGLDWRAASGISPLCPVEGLLADSPVPSTITRTARSFVVQGYGTITHRDAMLAIMRWPVGGDRADGLPRTLANLIRPEGIPWTRERTVDAPWRGGPEFFEIDSVMALRELARCLATHKAFPARGYDLARCEFPPEDAPPPPATVRDGVRQALDDLDELSLWREGWLDGEGAAPDAASLDAMTTLVCALASRGVAAPRVFLTPEGEAVADWRPPATHATVTVSAGGRLFHAHESAEDRVLDGETRSDGDVHELAQLLAGIGCQT